MQCRNNSLSYLVIYFIFLLFYFFIILFCLCILKILVTHFIIRRLAWNSKCPSRFCFTGRVASSPFLLCILSVKFGYKPVTTKPQWFSVSKIPRLRNWEGDMNDDVIRPIKKKPITSCVGVDCRWRRRWQQGGLAIFHPLAFIKAAQLVDRLSRTYGK